MRDSFKKLELNQDHVQRANAHTMFNAGNTLQKEAEMIVMGFNEKLLSKALNEEQREYAIKRQNEFVGLVTEAYNDQISRRADNPSWAITGPANYNYKAAEKKTYAALKKSGEYAVKIRRFINNTEKGLKDLTPAEDEIARWRQGKWGHGETISSDDPLAKEKLTAKLEYLEERQEFMKQANAIARKEKRDKPYPSFALTNNNATIKATKDRIEGLSKAEQRKGAILSSDASSEVKEILCFAKDIAAQKKIDSGELVIKRYKPDWRQNEEEAEVNLSPTGVRIIQNTDINRLQIEFDDKPDEEMRSKLKSNGFKWAPSQGVWQRQLTDNAISAVKRIFN